jgi:hypothetical protein
MKKAFVAILSICFVISNAFIVGAINQHGTTFEKKYEYNTSTYYDDYYDLLIVTPDEFKEGFNLLKTHKDSKGLSTKIIGLNDIYDSVYFPVEGRDNAEQIKYFIKNAKENWDITYVMLVGGKEKMPVRYSYCTNLMRNIGLSKSTFISDLYYADLFDENGSFCSWDSNNNNTFGEIGDTGLIDNVDLYPDVYVGRLLCSDLTEVERIVNKIIDYENNVFGESWLNNMVLCGGDTHPSVIDELMMMLIVYSSFNTRCSFAFEGQYICEEISKMMDDYTFKKCYTSGILRQNTKLLNVNNINDAINQGSKFSLFSGHGMHFSYATHPPFSSNIYFPFSSGYTVDDINNLDNEDKLTISIFNCCLCANFDDVEDPIAWQFVNHENGGSIGSIGCTMVSWMMSTTYAPNTYNGFLTMEFLRSHNEGTDILGELWGDSITGYLDDEKAMSSTISLVNWIHYICLEEWILLGDPSLKIGGYEQ